MTQGNDGADAFLDEIYPSADPETAQQAEGGQGESDEEQRQPNRGPDGKFVKAEAAADAGDGQQQDEGTEQSQDGQQQEAGQRGGTVPHQALHAEREARKAAEAKAETFERSLAEMRGQMQTLQAMLSRQGQPQPQAQDQGKPPDFWEDPNAFVRTAVDPIQKQLRQQAVQFSYKLAVRDHGEETVKAAADAMRTAVLSGDQAAIAEYQRIDRSDFPIEEIVKWHKRSETLKQVGDDPQKWLEAELAKRKADPAFQAEIIAAARGAASAGQQQPSANGSVTQQLPRSIHGLPGGGHSPGGAGLASEAQFAQATAGMR